MLQAVHNAFAMLKESPRGLKPNCIALLMSELKLRPTKPHRRQVGQVLDRVPGFAVLLGQELVGLGIVQELLVVAVPAQLAS